MATRGPGPQMMERAGNGAARGHADPGPRGPVDGEGARARPGGAEARGDLAQQVVGRAVIRLPGRFGNAGQADYSAANDLLCKITSSFRTARPGTRALAIDWTAWAGIGMATRGSVPQMMERAGIEM